MLSRSKGLLCDNSSVLVTLVWRVKMGRLLGLTG